jgi:hypothetical protein
MSDQESIQSNSETGDMTRRTMIASAGAAGLAIAAGTVPAEAQNPKGEQEKHETRGYLIVTNEENPRLERQRGGKTYKAVSVMLADPSLKPAKPIAARLCGGSGTCLALVEVD